MAGGEHGSHITEPLCDKAGSNLITKRGLSKHARGELHLPLQQESSDQDL